MMPRFSKENFGKNLGLVKDLQKIAKSKGCSPAQLAIGWVSNLSLKDGNPEIIPIPGATTEARVLENSKVVTLSSSELAEIDAILKSFTVAGDRYGGPQKVRFQLKLPFVIDPLDHDLCADSRTSTGIFGRT